MTWPLSPTDVKTGAYNAANGDFVPVDASGNSVAITLPDAPANQSQIGIKVVRLSGSNIVTVACSGLDTFNDGSVTSLALSSLNQAVLLQYDSGTTTWWSLAVDLELNVANGAAKLGTDGSVGGPAGSPLASSVLLAGSVPAQATGVPWVFNVKDGAYGATGDGTTDDTAAINAAINAAKAQVSLGDYTSRGAIVFFPPGVYICSGFLTACQKATAVTLQGAGNDQYSSLIVFTGSGPLGSYFLDFRGASSVAIKNLGINYTSSAFLGDLCCFDWAGTSNLAAPYSAGTDSSISVVDASLLPANGTMTIASGPVPNVTVQYTSIVANIVSGLTVTSGSGTLCPAGAWCVVSGGDAQRIEIGGCQFAPSPISNKSANSLVRFGRAIAPHLHDSAFYGAQYGVQLGSGPGSYVNGFSIDGQCNLGYSAEQAIYGAGSVNNGNISGNVFEGSGPTSGTMSLFYAARWANIDGLRIENNWTGDVNTPGGYITLGGGEASPQNGIARGIFIAANSFSAFTSGGNTLTAAVDPGATTISVTTSNFAEHFPSGGGFALLAKSGGVPPGATATNLVQYASTDGVSTLSGVTGVTSTWASGSVIKPITSVIKANGTIGGLAIVGNHVSTLATLIDQTPGGSVYGALIAGNSSATDLVSTSPLNFSHATANSWEEATASKHYPALELTPLPEVVVTVAYQMLPTDRIVDVDSTAGAIAVTLPRLSTVPIGRPIIIKDEGGQAATNNIMVARSGSDKIDNATSITIDTDYGCLVFYAGSSQWRIVSQR